MGSLTVLESHLGADGEVLEGGHLGTISVLLSATLGPALEGHIDVVLELLKTILGSEMGPKMDRKSPKTMSS